MLLARIHRYTVKRLRAEIEPVPAAKHLDNANVGVLFEQVGGEAVPQRVWLHPLP